LWNINGLIDKLVEVNAVEKCKKGLIFTISFRRFLVCRLRADVGSTETLEGWRIILSDYHYSLISLTSEEIGATVVLLDYYFQQAKMAPPAGNGR
jgi:hypothetical protein